MSQTTTTGAAMQPAMPGINPAQWAFRRSTGFAILVLAIVQQSLGHHNPDSSWLIHVCERLLDGARIYVDPIETNPLASFLIYLPAVATARLLRLPSELLVSVFFFVGTLASLGLCNTIARRAKLLGAPERVWFFNAGVFALLLVPGMAFAQREHAAAIAIAPMLVLFAARAAGEPVRTGHAILAGVLAGVSVALKPFFVLALVLPFGLALWRQRQAMLVLKAEAIAGALTVALYAASVPLLFPEFLGIVPALLDTYVRVTIPISMLLRSPFALFAALAMVLALLACRRRWHDRAAVVSLVLTLAASGFLVAALVQGKGWLNHFLPAIALALLALAMAAASSLKALTQARQKPDGRALVTIGGLTLLAAILPIVFGAPNQFAMQEEHPGLRAAITRHAPPHPKMMALAVSLDAGFPVTRQVGGLWVGRRHILWQMAFARILLDRKAGDEKSLQAYIDADARMFAEDVRDRRPDVIVVGKGPVVAKIREHPLIVDAMTGYRRAQDLGDVDLWVRRTH